MLDFVSTVMITATIVVCFSLLVSSLNLTIGGRFVAAVALALWFGLAIALGSIEAFVDAGRRPVPLTGIMFGSALIAAATLAALWPAARRALLSAPMPILVGLHIPRLMGGMFLVLAATGRLEGPFPIFQAFGDMAAAAVAIPCLRIAARPTTDRDWILRIWNVFGALDLLVAISLAMLSTPGSAVQIIHGGVGPEAMQHLPLALIPSVLAPFWVITHGIIFGQLRARASAGLRRAAWSLNDLDGTEAS